MGLFSRAPEANLPANCPHRTRKFVSTGNNRYRPLQLHTKPDLSSRRWRRDVVDKRQASGRNSAEMSPAPRRCSPIAHNAILSRLTKGSFLLDLRPYS